MCSIGVGVVGGGGDSFEVAKTNFGCSLVDYGLLAWCGVYREREREWRRERVIKVCGGRSEEHAYIMEGAFIGYE